MSTPSGIWPLWRVAMSSSSSPAFSSASTSFSTPSTRVSQSSLISSGASSASLFIASVVFSRSPKSPPLSASTSFFASLRSLQ